ncbi:YadA C-terminal domain-containing protein [Avibacterium sp. 21-599]|uniref:YadA C-terminal domain-containing protein n=1 Tax=Avibacterium sp. 21-599 TaxID=2911528 RepID=UPI002245313B|nr:YadA C-terminal domain-containing protein [Avibacterium sp. 21-599]MCW9718559.1 YadA C-terminal domain-containing protein [Avibacterium sp. 21-599]
MIKSLVGDAVDVVNGTNTTVSKTIENGKTHYAVNVDNTTIKSAIQTDLDKKADKTALASKADKVELVNKANIDASNIVESKWAERLGTGTISSTDTHLVTGKTVYKAIEDATLNRVDMTNKADKNASNLTQQDIEQWREKLVADKIEANNKGLVTSGQVHHYVQENRNKAHQEIHQLRRETNKAISSLRKESRAGISSAMAMSAIQSVPGKRFTVGAGVGSYGSESAVAIGIKVKPRENVVLSLSGSVDSRKNVGGAAGVSFGFD